MNFTDLHRTMTSGRGPSRLVEDWAAEMLADIAGGRRDLAALHHPLGFICLPVIRLGDDGVCVHIWSADQASAGPTTSQRHSHSWDLVSYVLYGRVRNETVALADDPVSPTYRVFQVRSQGNVDQIIATDRRVRHSVTAVDVHESGAVYTLRAGVFHATEIFGGEAATVALGRVRPGESDCSLGALDLRTHSVRRRYLDRWATAAAARAAAAQLRVHAI
jgi:hypothetical protein